MAYWGLYRALDYWKKSDAARFAESLSNLATRTKPLGGGRYALQVNCR